MIDEQRDRGVGRDVGAPLERRARSGLASTALVIELRRNAK
jgi:hypothetical protein